MDRSEITKTWLLLILVVISATIISVGGQGGQHRSENVQGKPSLAKMAMNTISSLKKSHQSSWDKIKSIIREGQLQFFPPNLDFRGANDGNGKGEISGGGSTAGGRIKEAAAKSIGSSKMTAEESAKSAAKVVGEAMHKTTKKMKNTMSSDGEPHDEL